MRQILLFRITVIFLIGSLLTPIFAQNQYQKPLVYGEQSYPQSGERYITDEHGVIRMWINVLGWVNKPGSILVYDGIDIVTVLAIAGGYQRGANLKKIRVFREKPDENGKILYTVDLNKYLKTGNREAFIKILPNDTVIIPQTLPSYVLSYSGTLTTIMNLLYYYSITQLNLSI